MHIALWRLRLGLLVLVVCNSNALSLRGPAFAPCVHSRGRRLNLVSMHRDQKPQLPPGEDDDALLKLRRDRQVLPMPGVRDAVRGGAWLSPARELLFVAMPSGLVQCHGQDLWCDARQIICISRLAGKPPPVCRAREVAARPVSADSPCRSSGCSR